MSNQQKERVRTCRFSPYKGSLARSASFPTFTLHIYDLNKQDSLGKWRLGYELIQHRDNQATPLFSGEDFGCSLLHAVDSNETVRAIMSFLTLRPGDTDSEYFDSYNQTQLDFVSEHAETLSMEVENRFGDKKE